MGKQISILVCTLCISGHLFSAQLMQIFDFENRENPGSGIPQSGKLTAGKVSGKSPSAADLSEKSRPYSKSALNTEGGFVISPPGKLDIKKPVSAVSVWIKPAGLPRINAAFLAQRSGYSAMNYCLFYDSGKKVLYLWMGDKAVYKIEASVTLEENQWHFICFTQSGNAVVLYLNGELIGETQCPPPGNSQPVIIGALDIGGLFPWSGLIDDVCIWSEPLSEKEIQKLATGDNPMTISGSITSGAAAGRSTGNGALARTKSELIQPGNVHTPKKIISLSENGLPRKLYLSMGSDVPETAVQSLSNTMAKLSRGQVFLLSDEKIDKETAGIFVMFGRSDSALYNRLFYNQLVKPGYPEYCVRILPGPFGENTDIIAIEATNADGWNKASALAAGLFPSGVKTIQSGILPSATSSVTAVLRKEFTRVSTDEFQSSKNTAALGKMLAIACEYRDTGDNAAAEAFFKCAEEYRTRFVNTKKFDWHYDFPGFYFWQYAIALNLTERSAAATPEKLALAVDALRLMCEECFNHDSMFHAERIYTEQKLEYLYNHPLFASISLGVCADYMLNRYPGYEAAKYWQAVCDFALQGPLLSSQSYEDSQSYQWATFQCLFNYTLYTGRLKNVFSKNQKKLRELSDWVVAHFTHLGTAPSYGDEYALARPPKILAEYLSKTFPENEELRYVYQMPRSAPWDNPWEKMIYEDWEHADKLPVSHAGLKVLKMDDFLVEYHGLQNIFSKPLLNKAVFRSGWRKLDEELYLSGKSLGIHGHFDANAIIHYSRGPYYWFADGMYIGSQPRYHSVMIMECNGKSSDYHGQRSFFELARTNGAATVVGSVSSADRTSALLSSTLHDYCGTDWNRVTAWQALHGFFIIDIINARGKGMYYLKNRMRLIGNAQINEGRVEVTQKKILELKSPNVLVLENASGVTPKLSQRLDVGHRACYGYYKEYAYADPYTKIIDYVKKKSMERGEKEIFITLVSPHYEGDSNAVLQTIAENVFFADLTEPYLCIIGDFKKEDLEIQAECTLISMKNVCALKARYIRVGKVLYQGKEDDISYALPDQQNTLKKIFSGLKGTAIAKAPVADESAIQLQNAQPITNTGYKLINCENNITAGTANTEKLLCADEAGNITWYDREGTLLHKAKISGVPRAAAVFMENNESLWAVGAAPFEGETGLLYLFSDTGKMLWEEKIPPFHYRNGSVNNLRVFKNSSGKSVILAGCENWHYFAYSVKGEELWKYQALHAASKSLAEDLDGNGAAELIIGDEYQNLRVLDETGKLKIQYPLPIGELTSLFALPENSSVHFVFSHADGYLRACNLNSKEYVWEVNVGGYITCSILSPSGTIIIGTENDSLQEFSTDGERLNQVFFDDEVHGMGWRGNTLLVLSRSGYIYELNEKMKIRTVYKFGNERAVYRLPGSTLLDDLPVFWHGRLVAIPGGKPRKSKK